MDKGKNICLKSKDQQLFNFFKNFKLIHFSSEFSICCLKDIDTLEYRAAKITNDSFNIPERTLCAIFGGTVFHRSSLVPKLKYY